MALLYGFMSGDVYGIMTSDYGVLSGLFFRKKQKLIPCGRNAAGRVFAVAGLEDIGTWAVPSRPVMAEPKCRYV